MAVSSIGSPSTRHLVTPRSDLQIADRDSSASLLSTGLFAETGGSPAEHGLHPGDHYPGAERLGDVVVGAQIQAPDDVRLLTFGGQHDDGNRLGPRVRLESLANGQPVHARQHQIQDHKIRGIGDSTAASASSPVTTLVT